MFSYICLEVSHQEERDACFKFSTKSVFGLKNLGCNLPDFSANKTEKHQRLDIFYCPKVY